MILRLLRTDKMSAEQARKKGLTSVVLASSWEAYQIIGSEAENFPFFDLPQR